MTVYCIYTEAQEAHMTTPYAEQTPQERVIGADTVRVELVERLYDEGFSYRFLALANGQIQDVVELATADWDLEEAISYVLTDRWLPLLSETLDVTDRVLAFETTGH